MVEFEKEFTQTQRELLDLLWTTQTEAKVSRRFDNSDGTYRFESVVRPTRPIDFPVHPGEFVLKLHEKKPNAPLSEYYVNLRNLPKNLLTKVAEAVAESTREILDTTDYCAGIPSAGTPIADEFCLTTGIPRLKIFDKATDGSGRKIIGAPRHAMLLRSDIDGRRLLILDDLVTEADTKFEAAEVAKSLGYEVTGIAVLVDRQQGGREQLEAKGFRVFAPLPISEIFKYYFLTERIDRNRYAFSMNYLNDARSKSGLPLLALAAA